ncbi:MAG: hypothetical protein F6J86_37165 [Symploca sp. SIO1B1]|nr:hypothetical protein [Symploca sp. SIO1A3]NER99388.1 hypothetical protein [Symploca sp. SIO1B1]
MAYPTKNINTLFGVLRRGEYVDSEGNIHLIEDYERKLLAKLEEQEKEKQEKNNRKKKRKKAVPSESEKWKRASQKFWEEIEACQKYMLYKEEQSELVRYAESTESPEELVQYTKNIKQVREFIAKRLQEVNDNLVVKKVMKKYQKKRMEELDERKGVGEDSGGPATKMPKLYERKFKSGLG